MLKDRVNRVPLVLAVLGLILFVAGIVLVKHHDHAMRLTTFTNGSSVTTTSPGFGVYDSSSAGLSATCTSHGPNGTTNLEQPAVGGSVSQGDVTYAQIAVSATSLPPGTYTVRCTTKGGTLAIGARQTSSDIAGTAVLAAGVILLIAAVVRFLFRRRSGTQPPGKGNKLTPYDHRRNYVGPPPTPPNAGSYGPYGP